METWTIRALLVELSALRPEELNRVAQGVRRLSLGDPNIDEALALRFASALESLSAATNLLAQDGKPGQEIGPEIGPE